ncbi:MAG: dUTP diphosphatase [Chlamydiales bacterium]|jgi:dUTP pyrophosphatase|nr:dUTP diphosphatase [Chlamydiales bacterium]
MSERLEVGIDLEEEKCIPEYVSEQAAGADVRAYITKEVLLQPGASILIPTGIYLEIPNGYEVQIRPRSGLALKQQITVLNSPGTVDSDYRGEIKIILINHGKSDFIITPGMRIAQIVFAPVMQAVFTRKSDLAITKRGEGGFGHTGTH